MVGGSVVAAVIFGLIALVQAYRTGYDRGRWEVWRAYSERETCPCPECVGQTAYERSRTGGPR